MRKLICAMLLALLCAGSAQALEIWPTISCSTPKGTNVVQFGVWCLVPIGLNCDVSFRCQYFVDGEVVWDTRIVGTVYTIQHWEVIHRACLDNGPHTFALRVDVDNEYEESNEENNYLEESVTWERANWTFLVYMYHGGNLEQYAEAAWQSIAAANPAVGEINVVVMRDRLNDPDYIVNTDFGYPELEHYRPNMDLFIPEDLGLPGGEFQMGNGEWLRAFACWGVRNFPADNYAIALWDHGSGWRPASVSAAGSGTVMPRGIIFDGGDYISTRELGDAMRVMSETRGGLVNVLYLDACLMQMTEVAYEVKDYVGYMVGSECLGWMGNPSHYGEFLSWVNGSTPDWTLAFTMALEYHERFTGGPHTVSVLRLGQSPQHFQQYIGALNDFGGALVNAFATHENEIQDARNHTQTFDSDQPDGTQVEDCYVDIRDFAMEVRDRVGAGDPQGQHLRATAVALADGVAWESLIPFDAHESGWWSGHFFNYDLGTHGVSIYLPLQLPSDYYANYFVPGNLAFVGDTAVSWDEFVRTFVGERWIGWVRRPSGTPNPVSPGGQVQLDAEARGSLGGEVSYVWRCDGVEIANGRQQCPLWTAPTDCPGGTVSYTISVEACAGFEGVSEAASYSQAVTDLPPEATISSPADGARVSTATMRVAGSATDDLQVDRVRVRVNGSPWSRASGTADWSAWVPMSSGVANLIEAQARDSAGQWSAIVGITLNATADLRPVTMVSSPADGATVYEARVQVTGTATDDVSLEKVIVRINGGAWLRAAGTTSWSAWLSTGPGANLIEACARDDAGQWGSIVATTVSGVANLRPAVTFTSPADGAPASEAAVLVRGTAADDAGLEKVIVRVNGGAWMRAAGTTRWSAWATIRRGANLVEACVRDSSGQWGAIVALTLNGVGNLRPVAMITSPADGATVSQAQVTVSGNAVDDVSLDKVIVRVNGGSWMRATGTTSWSRTVNLAAGANLIEACARDNAGQFGPIASITVTRTGSGAALTASVLATPTRAGAEVCVTLSADASVTAEVLNIAGRPVRVIVQDRAMPAGSTTVSWNGRSENGLAVASGAYLVRITARTEDGAQSHGIVPLLVRR